MEEEPNNHNSNESGQSQSQTDIFNKSQSLIDLANKTFLELCQTLEHEQSKLVSLEERRKQLHDDMQKLKAELENEKKQLHEMHLLGSFDDDNFGNKSKTCFEENPDEDSTTVEPSYEFETQETTADEQTTHIKQELQSVLEECIAEQKPTN